MSFINLKQFILENIRWYQEWLGTKSVNQLTFPPLKLKRLEDDVPDRSVYEALCRGDYEVSRC